MHQLICYLDIKSKSDLEKIEFGWDGAMSTVRQAVRSTVHTTQRATPVQLVFGRDAILNVAFEADWQCTKERKLHCIIQNNKRRMLHASLTNVPSETALCKTGPIRKTQFLPSLGTTHGLSNQ